MCFQNQSRFTKAKKASHWCLFWASTDRALPGCQGRPRPSWLGPGAPYLHLAWAAVLWRTHRASQSVGQSPGPGAGAARRRAFAGQQFALSYCGLCHGSAGSEHTASPGVWPRVQRVFAGKTPSPVWWGGLSGSLVELAFRPRWRSHGAPNAALHWASVKRLQASANYFCPE